MNALSPLDAWVVVTKDCGNICNGVHFGYFALHPTPYIALAPGAEGSDVCSGSQVAGVDCGFGTQKACEAFSKTLPPVMIKLYQASPLGVYLKDSLYTDNIAGAPNPGWCVGSGHGWLMCVLFPIERWLESD